MQVVAVLNKAVLPLLVMLIGVCWRFGQGLLLWAGPAFDVVGLGDAVIDLQVWLLNNPEAGAEIGAWILIAAGGLMLIAVFAAPPILGLWRKQDLEIVYDPADADGRFGGVGPWHPYDADDETPPVTAFVLRVGVRNNGVRPILDVTATVEGTAIRRPGPAPLRFAHNHQGTIDLEPKRMVFVDVIALPTDPDAWTDTVSRLTVRVKARKTEEVARVFFLDKKRMPPMYAAEGRNVAHAGHAEPTLAAKPAGKSGPKKKAPSAPPA